MECYRCSREAHHKHHIISGRGFRKACETPESLIHLCVECHTYVHSSKGTEYNHMLRLELQAKYFKQGRSEEEVRSLMGDKLYLVGGDIYGKV